jgi:hypothetical protein
VTDLITAKINSLSQDVQQLRVRLDGLIAEKEEVEATSKNFSDDIEARLKALEDAENYRQQEEDAERVCEPNVFSHTLTERVALAITGAGGNNLHQARAAILVVAGELRAEWAVEAADWLEDLANND